LSLPIPSRGSILERVYGPIQIGHQPTCLGTRRAGLPQRHASPVLHRVATIAFDTSLFGLDHTPAIPPETSFGSRGWHEIFVIRDRPFFAVFSRFWRWRSGSMWQSVARETSHWGGSSIVLRVPSAR
ncbi:unnamed protein product, partial [Laminaria digitata]